MNAQIIEHLTVSYFSIDLEFRLSALLILKWVITTLKSSHEYHTIQYAIKDQYTCLARSRLDSQYQ